mmetsp:Transcript_2037/g.4387  ORF Transcript_2037/g.4387 Transcript_2037/m.4387 type:complete len:115 (-) Transcript_2037:310-654(-)|eukprot:CAMPEP_0201116194 /NCGR_PEP_ID=MMETSP0850-20130426/546_1 /ASSEMBLY_ACC=CAM_ASM_000622 /TAXON_ID=183588 /ORGANISM="Pseudo-nitzschia fraudulenta, Strain WWA7" /LENGTH=114 /DNA_ID=CAMNT_0047380217 /DNA_START=135 /DNA_END=479 /DNA_ORIENTATION=+
MGKKSKTETENKPDDAPKRKMKKVIPSVDYLLKHGDPETAHLPKTWFEIVGYPFLLAMVFAMSLLMFHHAPWGSLPPRKINHYPNVKRLSMFDTKKHGSRVPHLNKDKEKPTEL